MSSFVGQFYFSVHGRVSRQFYWLFGVTGFVLLGILLGVVLRVWGADVFAWALLLLAVWTTIAIHAKRLHDIGLSGLWMVAAWAIVLVIAYLLSTGVAQLFSLAIWVVVGLVPGTPGINRFGPDPTRSRRSGDQEHAPAA